MKSVNMQRRQSPVASRSARGTANSSAHSTPRGHHAQQSPRSTLSSNSHHQQQQQRSMTPRDSFRTGGSAGSTAGFSDLEEVLNDVVGLRMSSLTDLRRKIEELGSLQAAEERSFKDAMQLVMDQTTNARESQREAEEDYEERIQREKSERAKAVEIMQQFKKEGSGVMGQMKESLRTVTAKYHQELEKNAKLTAQLRKMEQQQRGGGSHNHGGGSSSETDHLRTQVDALSQLLEEEDSVVVELQQRNRSLERQVRQLSEGSGNGGGAGNWLSVAGADDPSLMGGETPGEYYDLLSSIKAMDRGVGATSGTMSVRKSQELIEKLKRFSLILMQRLKVEQRQRLNVEEQAAKMAAVQDDVIQKYEIRQQRLTTPGDGGSASRSSLSLSPGSHGGGGGGAGGGLGGNYPTAMGNGNYGGPSVGVSKSMNSGAPHLQGRTVPPSSLQMQMQGQHQQPPPPSSSSYGRSASNASSSHQSLHSTGSGNQPASLPVEPQQQVLVGLETIDMTSEVGGVGESRSSSAAGGMVSGHHPSLTGNVSIARGRERREHGEDEPSTGPPASDVMPSLEEQLEAVSTDFELSLQQWSDAIGGGSTAASTPHQEGGAEGGRLSAEMEQHFLPDEDV